MKPVTALRLRWSNCVRAISCRQGFPWDVLLISSHVLSCFVLSRWAVQFARTDPVLWISVNVCKRQRSPMASYRLDSNRLFWCPVLFVLNATAPFRTPFVSRKNAIETPGCLGPRLSWNLSAHGRKILPDCSGRLANPWDCVRLWLPASTWLHSTAAAASVICVPFAVGGWV